MSIASPFVGSVEPAAADSRPGPGPVLPDDAHGAATAATLPRLRIAVIHPAFLGGGAEAVSAWTIQALLDEYDVTLVTLSNVELSVLDQYYGTRLASGNVALHRPLNRIVRRLVGRSLGIFSVRQYLISRAFKASAHRFDLAISTFNELDMGTVGIQYVHFPMFSARARTVRELVGFSVSPWREMASTMIRHLAGVNDASMNNNICVTNSQWTASVLSRVYDVDPVVVYPPVQMAASLLPWAERKDEFVCISRLVEEKQIDRAIAIIEGVRQRGHDVALRLIGGLRAEGHSRLVARFLEISKTRSDWMTLEFNLSRVELADRLARARYGIHVRENEQFGIAVAEMTTAGCIAFVPRRGGAREIVGSNSCLTFDSNDEAIDRICSVLSQPDRQSHLSKELAELSHAFTAEIFMNRMRVVVADAIREASGARAR